MLFADLLFPLFLVLGVLVPLQDPWRQPFEIALLPIFVWLLWRHGIGGRRATLALLPPLAWIVWLGASGGWGTDAARERWDHLSLAALMTALFFVSGVVWIRCAPGRWLGHLALALVLASTVSLLGNLMHRIWIGDLTRVRLTGTGIFEHEILGAFVASFVALLAMHVAASAQAQTIRAAMTGYVLLAFVHVVLTGSRSGLIVYLISLAAYLFFRDPRSLGSLSLRLGAALAGILVLIALLFPDMPQFLADSLNREVYRLRIWQETVRLAGERPVLGHGVGDDTEILGRFSHPHNVHLSNYFYGGIPALFLGLLTLGAALYLAWRLPKSRCRALALASLIFVIVSTSPDTAVPISKPGEAWYRFWLPLAIVWRLYLRGDAR